MTQKIIFNSTVEEDSPKYSVIYTVGEKAFSVVYTHDRKDALDQGNYLLYLEGDDLSIPQRDILTSLLKHQLTDYTCLVGAKVIMLGNDYLITEEDINAIHEALGIGSGTKHIDIVSTPEEAKVTGPITRLREEEVEGEAHTVYNIIYQNDEQSFNVEFNREFTGHHDKGAHVFYYNCDSTNSQADLVACLNIALKGYTASVGTVAKNCMLIRREGEVNSPLVKSDIATIYEQLAMNAKSAREVLPRKTLSSENNTNDLASNLSSLGPQTADVSNISETAIQKSPQKHRTLGVLMLATGLPLTILGAGVAVTTFVLGMGSLPIIAGVIAAVGLLMSVTGLLVGTPLVSRVQKGLSKVPSVQNSLSKINSFLQRDKISQESERVTKPEAYEAIQPEEPHKLNGIQHGQETYKGVRMRMVEKKEVIGTDKQGDLIYLSRLSRASTF